MLKLSLPCPKVPVIQKQKLKGCPNASNNIYKKKEYPVQFKAARVQAENR